MEKDYMSDDLRVKATTAWTYKDVNSERGTEQFVDLGFDKNIFPRPKPLIPIMILMLQCVRSELLKWQLQRLNLISKLCIKLPVAKGIGLSYNTLARS